MDALAADFMLMHVRVHPPYPPVPFLFTPLLSFWGQIWNCHSSILFPVKSMYVILLILFFYYYYTKQKNAHIDSDSFRLQTEPFEEFLNK